MVHLPSLARDEFSRGSSKSAMRDDFSRRSSKSARFVDNGGPLDSPRKVTEARARLRTSRSRHVDMKVQEYMDCYHQAQIHELDEAPSERHPNGSQTDRPSTNYFERNTWFAAKAVLAAQDAEQLDEKGRRFFIDKFTGRPVFKAAETRRRRAGGGKHLEHSTKKPTNTTTDRPRNSLKLSKSVDTGRIQPIESLSQEDSMVTLKQELKAERRLVEQRLGLMEKAWSRYETGKKAAFHAAKQQASVEREQATQKIKLDMAPFLELQAQVQKRLNAIVIIPPSLPPILPVLRPSS